MKRILFSALLVGVSSLTLFQTPAWAAKWEDLSELAHSMDSNGNTKKAEELYLQSAEEAKKLGEASEAHRSVLADLAIFYDVHNRTEKALAVYDQLIVLCQSVGDPQAVSYLELSGDLYCQQGNVQETSLRYQKSIALQEKTLGPDHPEIGRSKQHWARCLMQHKRYGEAQKLYQDMLSNREKASGPDSLKLFTPLVEFARFYKEQHKDKEAQAYYQRALDLYEKQKKADPKNPGVLLLKDTVINTVRGELKSVSF
ncbi:MAG: tetratricopeptide repeat protein [Cyanobacteria bacterium]|nr:tetratricopeptide repeat protein [Cyanobacteriota bacterium]